MARHRTTAPHPWRPIHRRRRRVAHSVCHHRQCVAHRTTPADGLKVGVANVGGPQIGLPRFAQWVADLAHRESRGCIWVLSEMRPSQAPRMAEYESIARVHGLRLFASAAPFGTGGTGVAVLVPVAWCGTLTRSRELVPGKALRIEGLWDSTLGGVFTVLAVYGPRATRECDEALAKTVVDCVQHTAGPLVLAGDFNRVTQNCHWLQKLEHDGRLVDTTAALGATHLRGRAIDRIYVSANTAAPHRTRLWPTASDHLAVVADWTATEEPHGPEPCPPIGHWNAGDRWRRAS